MLRPHFLFDDRQGPFVERFGLGVLGLGVQVRRQIVQGLGDAGMLGSQSLLTDRQYSSVERLRGPILYHL